MTRNSDRFPEYDFHRVLECSLEDIKKIIEYRNFLLPRLPGLIKKCTSEISKKGNSQTHYFRLLEILYVSILLFYALDLMDETDRGDLNDLQDLFGNSFELERDLRMFRHWVHPLRFVSALDDRWSGDDFPLKQLGVNGNFFEGDDSACLRQCNLTGFVKFQKIRPHLPDLLIQFGQEKMSSQTYDPELISCHMVLTFLKRFIDHDYRSQCLNE